MRRFISIIEGISDIRAIGDMDANPYGQWQPGDEGILRSPKGIKKIEHLFSRTKQDFNLYVIFPTARKEHFTGTGMGLVSEVKVDQLEKALGRPLDREGKITMVYFNNVAGNNGKPMNAWTMAHRMGHGIQISIRNRVECHEAYDAVHHEIALVYNEFERHKTGIAGYATGIGSHTGPLSAWPSAGRGFLEFLMDLMTMKSARDRRVNNHDLEVFCELIAQYLIGGKVRFNRLAGIEEICAQAEAKVNSAFEELLDKLVGHVISM